MIGSEVATALDVSGFYGCLMSYSVGFALIGSAVLVFIYLWMNGRLDMDEGPKMQMLRPDSGNEKEE